MNSYANLSTRIASYIGDIFIVGIVLTPLLFIDTIKPIGFNLIGVLVWCIYSTYFNASPQRGTFGKKMMGLKVEHVNGKKLNYSTAFMRYVFSILPFSFFISIFTFFFTKRKQCLQDILTKSVVRIH